MPKLNHQGAQPCWAPPAFPETGRLALLPQTVNGNYLLQVQEEQLHRRAVNQQQGMRAMPVCCQSLHISLFFDGTGNNEYHDTHVAQPPSPSNIARLYHATYHDAEPSGYFRYYMPGVGTPFPEINEFDYSSAGLAFARGGEDRINWALLRLVDALMYTLTPGRDRLNDDVARNQLAQMRAHWPITGEVNRRIAITNLLAPLRERVALVRPKPLAIKLFVYGFSRGAASARTFVNWLAELFTPPAEGETPEMALLGLPVRVHYLGVLDTVASVGLADLVPGATGHMGWANNTLQLPDEVRYPGYVRRCDHFVAAHEQRQSFPLDSVRRADGSYPQATREVVYPGMHSDVGGGYPPGDQGKARGGDGELLSQIVLHDLYRAAFAAGAPLAVLPEVITPLIRSIQPSHDMNQQTFIEFDIQTSTIRRFNLWRATLLDTAALPDSPPPASDHADAWQPYRLPRVLENVLNNQMGWITAWRIGRYARNSLLVQPFFLLAPQHNAEQAKQAQQAQAEREQQRRKARNRVNRQEAGWQRQMEPGNKWEPTQSQHQLREAAREFEHDYRGWYRVMNGTYRSKTRQFMLDGVLKYPVFMLKGEDEKAEYDQMKAAGDGLYHQLFTDELGSGTREMPGAELLALYDEHIHDSRAWFMQSELGSREPWGDYFRYRMLFFGQRANKHLRLIYQDGRVVGAGEPGRAVEYTVISWDNRGQVADRHQIKDLATGEYTVIEDTALLAVDDHPDELAAQWHARLMQEEHDARMQAVAGHITGAGAKFIG